MAIECKGGTNMRAVCTWGEGPDVLVVIEGTIVILYEDPKHTKPPRGDYKHGYVEQGSFDFTAEEAEVLGNQLLEKAKQARDMDKQLKEHFNNEQAKKSC